MLQMKDLLNREHYCYKIHTTLMEKSGSFPLNRQPPLYELPPVFTRKSLSRSSMIFQKSLPPPYK